MFKITINVIVTIKGCPASGIAAVDYRRACRLHPAPDDDMRIEFECHSEDICRKFSELLDPSADLRFNTNYLELEPEVLAAFDPDTPETVVPLIEALAAAQAEKRAAASARDQEDARRRAADVERRRESEAKEERGRESLKRWAESRGSALLKARIEEGFDWAPLAGAEFGELAFAALGLAECENPPNRPVSTVKECKTPDLEEIEALRAVRGLLAHRDIPGSAELARCKYEPAIARYDDDDSEESPAISRNEVCITIVAPDGSSRVYYVLPADVPAGR